MQKIIDKLIKRECKITRIMTFNMFKDIQVWLSQLTWSMSIYKTWTWCSVMIKKESATCIRFDAREHEACINRSIHDDGDENWWRSSIHRNVWWTFRTDWIGQTNFHFIRNENKLTVGAAIAVLFHSLELFKITLAY